MSDRRYTIVSTSSLPMDRIGTVTEHVELTITPFTEILAREDSNLLASISALSEKKITAIFTSAQAVRITAASLKKKPVWKIYCIRNETRIAAISWFGSESIKKFASNAAHLSQQIISDGIKKAVFFCGDQRMDVLPDALNKKGIELTELVVYETKLTPVKLEQAPDAILFFSPTAVRSFFSVNRVSSDTAVFAMGKTTAAALKGMTGHPVFISPEADKTFVFNMALEYAAAHPIL